MPLLAWIIVFCLIGGVLSVLVASMYLALPAGVRVRLTPHLVSFATGALLGAAFLTLLPHAIAAPGVQDVHSISLTVLLGILGFFLLEKFVLWRHCHSDACEVHGPEPEHPSRQPDPAGTLILIGDGLHNFVDGVLIAAAFLTDVHVGVVTAFAVAAHEIPQEVGDFSILLHSGFSRARALGYNALSGAATVVGGVLAYLGLSGTEAMLPYVLAVAASSFIYIAVADLIPDLHKHVEGAVAVQQIALISAGALVIFAAHASLH